MKVAIDAGPLYGHRTGVGMATAGMIDALARRDDVDLVIWPEAALPMFGIMVLMVFVLIWFPEIATWLPDNLRSGPG